MGFLWDMKFNVKDVISTLAQFKVQVLFKQHNLLCNNLCLNFNLKNYLIFYNYSTVFIIRFLYKSKCNTQLSCVVLHCL